MQIRIGKPIVVGEGENAKTLSKSITVGDGDAKQTVDVLDLNLDAMTGADIDFCAREASAAKGESVRVLVTDLEFHIQVASRSSGVPVESLKKLSARDYVEVATSIQAFLTGSV